MKNNKLFNKVLSKSAMLLVVAGLTVTTGVPNYLYAQEVATESTTEEVAANNESVATPAEGALAEIAQARGTTQEARGIKVTWSTSSNCNVTKPSKPNINKPNINKPNINKPNINKPNANKPETNKPETNKPETNKPETNKPETNKPETSIPETNQAAFENEVLRLVNVERQKQGLSALQMDESVRNVARVKATDMYKNKYFSHTSPTYGSPFDMLKKFGITYKAAAENIAQGQTTPAQVVKAWMNSSGHRANILNAKYTHIGIGYEANGNNWVQMFIGK